MGEDVISVQNFVVQLKREDWQRQTPAVFFTRAEVC